MGKPGRTNYTVVCPDDLGLERFISKSLGSIAVAGDVSFYDAGSITKEKARQIELESRRGSLNGSKLQHVYIHHLQNLPSSSVGPLLKVVEDGAMTRFIFQCSYIPRKVRTLSSRSSVVKLPFLSEKAVLANIQAMGNDAKTVDELGLYDGTLNGTLRGLGMKDTLASFKRELSMGLRAIPGLYGEEMLNSLAFDTALRDLMNQQEKDFYKDSTDLNRKRLAILTALSRK